MNLARFFEKKFCLQNKNRKIALSLQDELYDKDI